MDPKLLTALHKLTEHQREERAKYEEARKVKVELLQQRIADAERKASNLISHDVDAVNRLQKLLSDILMTVGQACDSNTRADGLYAIIDMFDAHAEILDPITDRPSEYWMVVLDNDEHFIDAYESEADAYKVLGKYCRDRLKIYAYCYEEEEEDYPEFPDTLEGNRDVALEYFPHSGGDFWLIRGRAAH